MEGQESSGTQTSDGTGNNRNNGNIENDRGTGRRLKVVQGVILSVCTALGAVGAIWAAYETMLNNKHEKEKDSHIEITSPSADEDRCYEVHADRRLVLEGTGKMAAGIQLWGITRADTFYVSAVSDPKSPDGGWTMTIKGIGRRGGADIGKEFTLDLVGASANAASELQDAFYLDPPMLDKLPKGAKTLESVCMKRVA